MQGYSLIWPPPLHGPNRKFKEQDVNTVLKYSQLTFPIFHVFPSVIRFSGRIEKTEKKKMCVFNK